MKEKEPAQAGSLGSDNFLDERSAAGRRHDAIAIGDTGGWIEAAKIGMKASANLLEFFVTQKAGADASQYTGLL